MAAQYTRVKGYIKDGRLYVELPDDVPDGEVELLLPETTGDQPWTEVELQDLLTFKGQTLGEILESGVVGAGTDWEIGDSEEWAQGQRRKLWNRR